MKNTGLPSASQTAESEFLAFREGGDAAALGRVFDALAPSLIVAAGQMGVRHGDAEDLLQATFVTAIQCRDRWDSSKPVFPWLVGILANKMQHARRRDSVRRADELRGTEPTGADSDPLARAASEECLQQVAVAAQSLSEPYREVLILKVTHGLSGEEIAHALSRPVGTVRVQLSRARQLVQLKLPAELRPALVLLGFESPVGLSREALRQVRSAVVSRGTVVVKGTTPLLKIVGAGYSLVFVLAATVVCGLALARAPLSTSQAGVVMGGSLMPVPRAPHDEAHLVGAERREESASTVDARTRKELRPVRRLKGRVVTDGNRPVANATIFAERSDLEQQRSWSAVRLGRSDRNGEFRVALPSAAAQWNLWARDPNGATSQANQVGRSSTPHGAPLAEQQTLRIPGKGAQGWLRGRIVDHATGDPIEGVRVGLEAGESLAPSFTGPGGRFRIGPLPRDSRWVGLGGPVLVARRSGLGVRMAPSRRLSEMVESATDDEASWFALYMDPGVERAGRIVFDDGTPASGATVELPYAAGKRGAVLSAIADTEGRFTLELPFGQQNAVLRGRMDGYLSCAATVDTSSPEGETPEPVEMRFSEPAGPRVVVTNLAEVALRAPAGQARPPYRLTVLRDDLLITVPLRDGAAILPPAATLFSGSWGDAIVRISGDAWTPFAEVHDAFLEDAGTAELLGDLIPTGSLAFTSHLDDDELSFGLIDSLHLVDVSTETPSGIGENQVQYQFGFNVYGKTTRFDHIAVGRYRAQDSMRREVLIEVKEGEVTKVDFSENDGSK